AAAVRRGRARGLPRGDPCHAPVTAATAAPSSASLRPAVQPRPGRGRVSLSGRDGRGRNRRRPAMTYELPLDDGYEPYHASSPTDRVIFELQMYGHRPHQDEPDPRPLPDDEVIRAG